MSSLSKIFGDASSSIDDGEVQVVTNHENLLEENRSEKFQFSTAGNPSDDEEEKRPQPQPTGFRIHPLAINRKSISTSEQRNPSVLNILIEDKSSNTAPQPRNSENFEIDDVYDEDDDGRQSDLEFGYKNNPNLTFTKGKGRDNTQSVDSKDSRQTASSNRSQIMKKGLVTINDLNDKFMSSNFYYVILAIILYIGVGIASYDSMMGWDRFECFYFIIITITTVGYGDYVPDTTGKRVFTAFYILLGVAIFGSLFSTITTFVQDHQERMAKLRSMRAMIRMKERDEELQRSKSTAISNSAGVGISLLSWQNGGTISDLLAASGDKSPTNTGGDQSPTNNGNFADGTNLQPRKSRLEGFSRRLSILSFSSEKRKEKTLSELRDASIATYEEDRLQLRRAAIMDFVGMFLLLIFGMIVMSSIEGWSSGDAFYWATVTILTVGYGDFTPTTIDGKVFTMFYCVFGCAYMAKAVTDFVKFPLLSRLLQNEIKVANQFSGDLSTDMLDALFHHDLYQLVPDLKRNENEMSKCEFVLLMLQVMNKVEEKDIFLAAKLFDNFDKLKNGYLSKEDMNKKMDEARKKERERKSMLSTGREDSGRAQALINKLRDRLPSMKNMFQNNSPSASPGVGPSKKQSFHEAMKASLSKKAKSMPPTTNPISTTQSALHESLIENEIPPSSPAPQK